jgi:hypothetical protein
MQEIDILLDTNPELSVELIDCEIRNRQAHDELQSYNDNKIFLFKHPFTQRKQFHDKILAELYEIKRTNPDAFIQECFSIKRNLQRYTKQIENDKFKDVTEKQQAQRNLERYELKNDIAQAILRK